MKKFVSILFAVSLSLRYSTSLSARILQLDDDERETHDLTRVYRVANEFYSNNETSIRTLIAEGFFEIDKEGEKNVDTIHTALRGLITERQSELIRNYEGHVKQLYRDVWIITQHLKEWEEFPGLTSEDVISLRKEMGGILHIASYVSTYDIGLGK